MGRTRTPTATRKPRAPQGVTESPKVQNEVALLKAEGMSRGTISRALDISERSVDRVLAQPEVQNRISELRDIHRLVTQEKLAGIAEKAWDLTEKQLDKGDAQGAMRMSATLVNFNKISQDTSGEKQRVEVSGIPGDSNPRIEIKNLLLALFPDAGKPTN